MDDTPEPLSELLDEVARALQSLDDVVVTVSFDQDDPASIEAAIQAVEEAIDAKIAAFRGNDLVESAADQLKAECRAGILEQVEDANFDDTPRVLH